MSKNPAPNPPPDSDHLNAVADQVVAACGGDIRGALKAMIVAKQDLELELRQLQQAAVTIGYGREFVEQMPLDRKDWYD